MMLDLLAQITAGAACLVIAVRAEASINRMSRRTPPMVRVAFLLLGIAACGALLNILLGEVPPWLAVIGSVGTAALLVCERRLRVLAGQPRSRDPEGA